MMHITNSHLEKDSPEKRSSMLTYLCNNILFRPPGTLRRKTKEGLRALHMERFLNRVRTRGQRDAVFVWIPKAAGTSIYEVMCSNGARKYLTAHEVRHVFPSRGLVTFGHMSYSTLLSDGFVGKEFDSKAFKFAFVRNPYDRLVSLYCYLQRIGRIHKRIRYETFCRMLSDGGYDPVGLRNSSGLNQCNPQVSWLLDKDGKMLVDYVGRFENLAEDFLEVKNRLGLVGELRHRNRSNHADYKSFYNRKCIEIVKTMYRQDLDCFEYTF